MKRIDGNCPVATTLGVVGGKWKTIILYHLNEEVHRFAELKRLLPGITQKVLTEQLRELERDGIVLRKIYAQIPPKVEYSLSEYGKTLRPVLKSMCEWGTAHEQRTPTAVAAVAPPRPVARTVKAA